MPGGQCLPASQNLGTLEASIQGAAQSFIGCPPVLAWPPQGACDEISKPPCVAGYTQPVRPKAAAAALQPSLLQVTSSTLTCGGPT